MPRTTSAALDAALAKQITQPGYLVRLVPPGGGSPMQLCDVGDIANPLGTFNHHDFNVRGAGTDSVALDLQNVDNAMGAFVLAADPLGDVAVRIWKFDKADPTTLVPLGEYLPQSATVGIDRVGLALRAQNLAYTYAPTKRVIPRDGFRFAMRPGEILLWGAQRILIKEK